MGMPSQRLTPPAMQGGHSEHGERGRVSEKVVSLEVVLDRIDPGLLPALVPFDIGELQRTPEALELGERHEGNVLQPVVRPACPLRLLVGTGLSRGLNGPHELIEHQITSTSQHATSLGLVHHTARGVWSIELRTISSFFT